jgi:amino acid adenylation domain-containing protein
MIDKKSLKFQAALAARQSTRERDYWLEKLSGIPDKVSFPSHLQKGASEQRMDTVNQIFPEELSASLSRLSSGKDHALHMVLTATLVLLLYKYTGSSDIVVGMPIYKQSAAAEFVNRVVALRNNITVNMTFKEILLQVLQTVTEAVEHQNYPIEILSEQLNRPVTDEDNDGFPLFDVIILLDNMHDKAYIEGISTNIVWRFTFNGVDNRLETAVEYNALFYKEDAIHRFIGHLIYLVEQVLANKDLPIADLSLITILERKQLLEDFSGVREPDLPHQTLHKWFQEQAARTPDNDAVICMGHGAGDHVSTVYRELNRKSNQLAHFLLKNGVHSETIVGLMAERSIEMVIGLLAIIKSGGAYLAIDAEYPESRKKYMLENSGVSLVLTNIDNVGAERFGLKNIRFIDVRNEDVYSADNRNPEPVNENPSANLLYVIYTSGSTGKPKGIMLEHQNLVNLVWFQFRHTNIDFSKVLQFTNISFDVAYQEIFSTLLLGGTLCLADQATRQNMSQLFLMVDRQQIKTLFFPASFAKFVLNSQDFMALLPRSVKHIITAGEQIVVGPLFRQYLQQHNISLHNHYGPSETHVVTTLTLGTGQQIPEIPGIGKPVANTRIYILDPNKYILPVGLPGELYIGGVQVGRGYLNRPELTVEKFERAVISHSSLFISFFKNFRKSNDQYPMINDRLFRTGDLARWLEDGNIEFLGRMDYQVKIRGFRIELGEIESQLLKHPDIKEVVVIDRETDSGEKYLCAYIIPASSTGAPGKTFNTEALREFLSHSLPDYMIPAFFIAIDHIPLTPNKKVDRRSLPEPESSRPQLETAYLEPSTRMEKQISDAWKEILRLDKIGINDNFFDLGGDSFKLIQASNKLKTVLNKDVPVMMMFQYPTIHSLAQYLKDEGTQDKTTVTEQKVHLEKKLDKGKARLKATRKKIK